MKKFMTMSALALLAAAAACGGSSKDTTQPPDTTVTPPPPPPPPGPQPPPPPPPPTSTANVFAAGNIGHCPTNGYAAETASLIDTSAKAVMVLGNAVSVNSGAGDNGTAANYACGFEPFWGKFRPIWHSAMGNLDVIGDTTGGVRNAPDYYAYFGAAAGPANQGWYSFDLNGWHIVVLNTEGGINAYNSASEQQKWLADDLATSTAKCKAAFFHRPFIYSGSSGASMNSNLSSIWSKLMAGGVDVVVTGGQYAYERMNPVNAAGAVDANGIMQFNVGMGGGVASPGTVNGKHPADAFWSGARGVLKLGLNADSFTWTYLHANGTTADDDSGSASCK